MVGVGDQVLVRLHLPGRDKIQDLWGERVHVVVSTPPTEGGPFVIRPQDTDGPVCRVTGSQIRLYTQPSDVNAPHFNTRDTPTSPAQQSNGPVSMVRRSSRRSRAPPRMAL